jgi:quercetin dioxygenase-like cupin family protein
MPIPQLFPGNNYHSSTTKENSIMTLLRTLRIHTAGFCLTGLVLFLSSAFAADYSSGVTAKVLTKTSATGNGQKITYPLTDRAEVTAMTVELAPGAETGWHKHPVPVYAYVVSGNLLVEIEGGKYLSFKAGEAIIEVVNTLHNGKNSGTEPVKLAVFYLGAEGTPNVIKPEPAKKSGKE